MRAAVLAVLGLSLLAWCAGSAGATRSALSVAVVGVEAGSYGARVGWQVSAPATVVVEYGLGDAFGIWTRRVGSGRDRSGRSTLSVLEPGREYRFRVVATAGGERAVTTGALTTRGQPDWIGASATPRGLTVAGQLLFPRMVFEQCPWAYPLSLAAGVNLFMGIGCGDAVDHQLSALRGRALSVTPIAGRRDGPGVVGFHHVDEADALVGRPEDLPLLPPSSTSGRPSFLTLTNHFFSASSPLPQGQPDYPAFVERAEMIGFDLYPLQIWCRRQTLHAVYEAQQELVELARGKPTYQWIEAANMSVCWGLDPSPAIVRAETWLAIAGGARGIGWFPDVWSTPVQHEIAQLSREIVALAPALLAEQIEATRTPADSPVRVGARRLNGAVYVIAVNSWTSPAKVRITVPGLNVATVQVFGGTRTMRVRNGSFVDSLRGLRTRVYVAAPSGG